MDKEEEKQFKRRVYQDTSNIMDLILALSKIT